MPKRKKEIHENLLEAINGIKLVVYLMEEDHSMNRIYLPLSWWIMPTMSLNFDERIG